MELPKGAHTLGSTGLKSLRSLLGPILSDKECSFFPGIKSPKKGGVL